MDTDRKRFQIRTSKQFLIKRPHNEGSLGFTFITPWGTDCSPGTDVIVRQYVWTQGQNYPNPVHRYPELLRGAPVDKDKEGLTGHLLLLNPCELCGAPSGLRPTFTDIGIINIDIKNRHCTNKSGATDVSLHLRCFSRVGF